MKLSIAILAASVLIRFETPGPGSYYLLSYVPGADRVVVESSNHATNAVHVTVATARTDAAHRRYWAFFIAD